METDDLLALGDLADLARRARGGGDEVYFVQNINLYQTNVCRVKCKFCAFAKTRKQEDAFTLTVDEFVEDAVAQHELYGFTEIHMVNGENPHVDLEYYAGAPAQAEGGAAGRPPQVLHGVRDPPHVDGSRAARTRRCCATLMDAGLDSMPGGGAEIFADRVRALIAPGKEHPDEWFDVHDTAHKLGITTQCTMLYGHVETYEERIDHLLRLRDQQDETGGFLSFIPLAFHPENTVFERRGFRFTTGADDLKVIAVSRLLLDNIPHVKAYWIMMGLPLAQVALHFGADDVQGTVVREKIFQAAGASAGTEQKVAELVRFVRDAAAFRCSATASTTSSPCDGCAEIQLPSRSTRSPLPGRDPRACARPARWSLGYVNMAPVFTGSTPRWRGAGRPDRAEPHARRGRARHGSDLFHRVRAARRFAPAAAASLRRLGGGRRLDPARRAACRSSACAPSR